MDDDEEAAGRPARKKRARGEETPHRGPGTAKAAQGRDGPSGHGGKRSGSGSGGRHGSDSGGKRGSRPGGIRDSAGGKRSLGEGGERGRKPAPAGLAWARLAVVAVAVVAVAWVGYAAFVSVSNGRLVELHIEVSGEGEGAVVRCVAGSTPSVCRPGDTEFHVGTRDRIRVTLHGEGAHDVRLHGGPYALWPAGFRLGQEGEASSFTAWARGSFAVRCAIHDAQGTLVVG